MKANKLNCKAERPLKDARLTLGVGQKGIKGHFQFLHEKHWGKTESIFVKIELPKKEIVPVEEVEKWEFTIDFVIPWKELVACILFVVQLAIFIIEA